MLYVSNSSLLKNSRAFYVIVFVLLGDVSPTRNSECEIELRPSASTRPSTRDRELAKVKVGNYGGALVYSTNTDQVFKSTTEELLREIIQTSGGRGPWPILIVTGTHGTDPSEEFGISQSLWERYFEVGTSETFWGKGVSKDTFQKWKEDAMAWAIGTDVYEPNFGAQNISTMKDVGLPEEDYEVINVLAFLIDIHKKYLYKLDGTSMKSKHFVLHLVNYVRDNGFAQVYFGWCNSEKSGIVNKFK